MAEYVTYGIRYPEGGDFFYVGQTSNFPARRKAHLRLAKKRPNYGAGFENIKSRMYDLLSEGLVPEIDILEVCPDEAASLASETRWVETLARSGHPLLNRKKEHRAITKAWGVS